MQIWDKIKDFLVRGSGRGDLRLLLIYGVPTALIIALILKYFWPD